jgi:hypothetical protein
VLFLRHKEKAVSAKSTKRDEPLMERFKIISIIAYAMFTLGLISLATSALYTSSVLVFIGLGLTFWSIILLYITPTKHVKLELLNATAHSTLANIEKVIANAKLNSKGIYLPPKYLKDYESSLIFIPAEAHQTLPKPEEIHEEKLYSKKPKGMFLTPPGLALSKLFEKTLGKSFTRTDLNYLQQNLPKLFIKTLKIAKDIDVKKESNTITIEVRNHVFNEICQETRKHQKTHESIGCPLCSGLACALAKATGKPVTIEKEEQDGETTRIQYHIMEEPKQQPKQ